MKKIKINTPTKITISRIVLAILLIISLIVFYFLDYFKVFLVSSCNIVLLDNPNITINYLNIIFLVVFLLASLTDFLDGYLARKNNEVTDLGKFLDPLADKMLINSLMIFYSVNFSSLLALNEGNHEYIVSVPFFVTILMVIRDLIVDSLRLMAAKKNKVIAANIFGKIKTVTQMIALSFLLLNGWPFNLFDYSFTPYLHISDILFYIALFFSLLSGFIYLKDNIHILFDEDNN